MNKKILIFTIIITILSLIALLVVSSIVSHKQYTNNNFNIETYISSIDKDNDGIDDQTDILNNAKKYIETKPKYKSEYYETGYPNGEYGVCTDVIGFALKNAGYNLMELVNDDKWSSLFDTSCKSNTSKL